MRPVLFSIFWLIAGFAMANDEKNVYGYIEKASLVDKNLYLPAKLDTGAKTASLNATNIVETQIGEKKYLHFTVPTQDGDVLFKSECVGKVNIKIRAFESHFAPSIKKTIKRPVVMMTIKLGNLERLIRVNLTNRKRFIYPLLLGREAINAFNGIVDPNLTYTIKTTVQ